MDVNARSSWQNTLSLTLGYGVLFSGLIWIYGKMPEAPFFIAAGFLLFSVTLFFFMLLGESFLTMLIATDENARDSWGGKAYGCLFRAWPWSFLVASVSAGVTAVILVIYSFAAASNLSYENEMTALRRENVALRQDLNQALSLLHHERLLHFGEVSEDNAINLLLSLKGQRRTISVTSAEW